MELESSVMTIDDYKSSKGDSIRASLDALASGDYKISAGLSGSFWLNMRCEPFACDALARCISKLVTLIKATKKKENAPYLLPSDAEPLIYSLVHMALAYNYNYSDSIYNAPFLELRSYNVPVVNAVLFQVEKQLGSLSSSFKTTIDDILDDHKSDLLNVSVPLLNFTKVLATLHQHSNSFWFFVSGFKSRLSMTNSVDESLVLLHVLKVCMALYPQQSGKEFSGVVDLIKDYLAKPSPVSDMAALLGSDVLRESKYPGSAYYSTLFGIAADNPAFDGTVPFFYDQKTPFFTNMTFSRSTQMYNVTGGLINFLDFFIKKKFNCEVALKTDRAIAVLSVLTFDDDCMEYVKKKLKIKPGPDDSEALDTDPVMPPVFNYSLTRLSLTYQVTTSFVVQLPKSYPLYGTPIPLQLQKGLLNQVFEKTKTLTEPTELIIQPVLIAGDDLMIGHVMTGIFSEIAQNPEKFANVVFNWYLVPVDRKGINEIASFIGRSDPIYKRFVLNSYHIATSIAPQMNDAATVDFQSIVEEVPHYPTHSWFADPSPSNLFQFSLNHYLLFGRDTIDVSIWRADIELDDEKSTRIMVPWMTAIHLGETFSGNTVLEMPPPFPKGQSALTIYEPYVGPYTEQKIKLKAMSIWNVHEEMNVRPTNDWFLAEWTKENIVFKAGERRATHAKKITSKVAVELSISAEHAFKALIDQRIYSGIKKMSVSKLIDPVSTLDNHPRQMKMRFAAFCTNI